MKRLITITALLALGAAATVAGLRVQAAAPKLPGTRIQDPLDYLVRTATIGAPRTYQDLAIYPVIAQPMPGFGRFVTLDDAMQRGWLKISEYQGGSVNEVMAQNVSDRNVFMMSGEMIGGAKQDRILRDDVLLRPHAKARIPVYCVEQHRWTGASDQFAPATVAASPVLRSRAQTAPSQEEVWAGVSKQQRDLGVSSPTGSARVVYENSTVQREVAPYRDKLLALPELDSRATGVVVVSRGSILVADLFYDRSLFRALWPKLLDSYIVDTLTPPPGYAFGGIRPGPDVRGFLQRMLQAQRRDKGTPGAGDAYDLRGNGIVGSALVVGQAVLHLELFPTLQVEPLRTPMPGVGWRRDQLEQAR